MIIKYITNVRVPTSRAQGYAIMKMCSEFAKAGAKVELFVPNRNNNESNQDSFDFYKIEKNFEINKIKSFDFLGKTLKFGKLFYWIDVLSFFISAKFAVKIKKGDILYTRDFLTLLFFSKKANIYLELHDIPTSKFLFKRAIKKPKLFFVLNQNIKDDLIKIGIKENLIHISPSGVDIEKFDIKISKEDVRKKLNLPQDKKIILYSGQLYLWKGAETLAETAFLVPEANFVFVGGVEPEFSKFKEKYGKAENILILPFQERSIIPLYLKLADVLVLPNSSNEQVSVRYTSPLKLFEYMASNKPIVASNLPSIREIVSEKECIFAEPDNSQSFADAIKKILENNEFAKNIANKAFEKAKQYSWQKRAEEILSIINSNKNK